MIRHSSDNRGQDGLGIAEELKLLMELAGDIALSKWRSG
jgi:hypothetical protein